MTKENNSNRKIINGLETVTTLDVEASALGAISQADAMEAFFRTIARLSSDEDIKALCAHGANQAAMQANDLDCLRERTVKAGFAM